MQATLQCLIIPYEQVMCMKHFYSDDQDNLISNRSFTGENKYCCYKTKKLSIINFICSEKNVMKAIRHCHDEYEFIIPLTPIPFLTNEDNVYFGEVGLVYPVQSGRMHGMKLSIADISYDDIIIEKSYFEELFTAKGLSGLEFNSIFEASEELSFYISAFKKECTGLADTNKLEHLAALICYELISLESNAAIDSRHTARSYQKGLRSVSEYINRYFDQPIKLHELAEMCGLSDNYFSHCYKMAFGDTPFSYLTKLRVSKAKNLLVTTTMPVCEIAKRCGYPSPSSLSTAFKAKTGMSPVDYRKQLSDVYQNIK